MCAVLGVRLVSVWVVVLGTAIQTGPAQAIVHPATYEKDRYCLACLCTAASGCDVTVGCVEDGGRDICGPFYISEPFWKDANVTVIPRFSSFDFRRCAVDVDCAAAVVTSYMSQFGRDCDGDGQITCMDYGLIHWLGYSTCSQPEERTAAERTTFYNTFKSCLQDVDSLLVAGLTAGAQAQGAECQQSGGRL